MGNRTVKQNRQISGKPKKFVHWKSAERPFPPGKPILIPVSDQQPDVITLKWDKPKSDGGSPLIGYILEHRRMGSSHWVRATPSLILLTEVSVSGLEPGWRYQFRAIAENVIGKSDPSELSDSLTVTLQRNAITVPKFIKELEHTTVVENERIEMKVVVLGQPPPEINWFKDGFEIFSSRRTKIMNDNETSVLIIHQCAFTDEGEIKCTATNRAGHVITKADLKIVAPPKIRLPRQYEDGLIVEAGETLRLKVGLAGQPPPNIIWSHEGEIIRTGGRYELVTGEKYSILKIENVKRSDRGEYSLRASNNLGEDLALFLVTVTSKPNQPGKIEILMSFGRSVTLVWKAPDDDGGCKIGNYIVEYFRIGWNVWLKAATTRQLSTTLHDLIEGSEYKFRVKAENPYGVSEASDDSDILFIPDPRSGITRPNKENIHESEPPVPPKRRTLSPIKNFLSIRNTIDRSPSPINRTSVVRNYQLEPNIFENEQLHRELSYGTPNDVLNPKETKKTLHDRAIYKQQEIVETKTSNDSEGTQSLSLQKIEQENQNVKFKSVNLKFQQVFNRSPRFSRRKMSLPEELLGNIPVDKTCESPKVERRDSLIVEKVQQFFKKSPSLSRKFAQLQNNATSLEKVPEYDSQLLQRKDSLIIEKVQNFFRRSPSPSRTNISTDVVSLIFDKSSNENNNLISVNKKSQKENIQNENISIQSGQNLDTKKEKFLPIKLFEYSEKTQQQKNESSKLKNINHNKNKEENRPLFCYNPRIEISKPKTSEYNEPSENLQKDDPYTSNEFMLVLHPMKKSREVKKKESFDVELEEVLFPPPISFSVPDLTSNQLYLQILPTSLRRSVSSTELLYERAMARFYQAVEIEESDESNKRLVKKKDTIQEVIVSRHGIISEEKRLVIEGQRNTGQQLSFSTDEVKNITMEDSKNAIKMENLVKSRTNKYENTEYGSDYTESTASSSGDSMEAFKTQLVTRTESTNDELETYSHNFCEGSFSPYRSPTPDQSAVILNKPLPYHNSDFIPKPILKRSSNENVIKEKINTTEMFKSNSDENKHKNDAFGFLSTFKKQEFQKSKISNSLNKLIGNTKEQINENLCIKSVDADLLMKVDAKTKAIEKRKIDEIEGKLSSEEETKVVIKHYSDIVKEASNLKNYRIPLYMRRQNTGEEMEIKDDRKQQQEPEEEDKEKLISKAQERPRLSIVERLQSAHVQNSSRLAQKKRPTTDSIEYKDNQINEIEEHLNESQRKDFDTVCEEKKEKTDINLQYKFMPGFDTQNRDNNNTKNKSEKNFISRNKSQEVIQICTITKRRSTKINEIMSSKNNKQETELRSKTPEELIDEAQEIVRSTISYLTDLGLFIIACWVYIFKDVRLVLPILALLVYRQLGEVLNNKIPDWLKKKKS